MVGYRNMWYLEQNHNMAGYRNMYHLPQVNRVAW
jgi:hypothetical protein